MPEIPRDEIEYLKGLDTDQILRMLGSAPDSEPAVMNRIVKASTLFHDPVAGRDPARIAPVEEELRACRAWMKEHGSRDGENDACWPLYLCYSRTGRDAEAIEALQALRHNLELARSNIANPVQRAGINARYPLLYPCLVGLLYKQQDNAGVLSAIEASKGRALADVMALAGGALVADQEFADASETIPELLIDASGEEGAAHYVTYLVDDDCTYAACVSARDGVAVDVARVPLSRSDLAGLAESIRAAADSNRPVDNMPRDIDERLASLVEVLGDFAREGDHVCYCPDDVLHLLPLQAALRDGAPLAKHVSVSRTHAARVLQQQLAAVSFDRAVVVEVPDTIDAADPKRLEIFTRAGNWLREAVDVTALSGKDATVDALAGTPMNDSLVHFATHGVYPPPAAKTAAANPYRNSGILLANERLLSPELLVKSGARFDRAHVTLQACVSGLAREGVGGDALGLEWALFQLGASSILSTHWNVSAQTSSAFAIRFYSRLLSDRKSRAAAWRETVLEFLGRSDALANPYHWSAFSLSGAWH